MSNGMIFDIKRFSIHDGPGIRSTVFFKGCPLSCAWCHNPESQSFEPELIFRPERCLACGECADACPQEAIQFIDGRTIQNWNLCQNNGSCVAACYPGAREIVGRKVSPEEIFEELVLDRGYYETSGGGVTFSGGEPLSQPDFLEKILILCKEAGLSTALDTCGAVPWETLENQLPYLDLVLYDLKIMDDPIHQQFTGLSNQEILNNFRKLAKSDAELIVRRPVIPNVNDSAEEISALGNFLKELNGRIKIDLLPYHALSADKYRRLGRDGAAWTVPSDEDLNRIQGQLESLGFEVGLRG